ncbi:LysM peptidoglycan-binding domain-containing protein [Paractinoplanes hotanensis]|uniref:LysM peptidoglycan-binding domain-containing protein n=1 Tax=Paractinoplanes hotanensis TaxID=2906497 RepID=A0ABT0XWS8_9ACTN|nr:LysM peptidoglycan-binding domain-containing protein [Actinoplanes hotanensis]MCM4078250.1 LysM peptidoglycan-binding domain-containing protein [Actinoplanes hotanensis]
MTDDEHMSEPARRRAAQYARQPSLWAAAAAAPSTASRPVRRWAQLIRTAMTVAALLGAPPWLLWTVFGNPITVWSSWWNTSPFTAATSASSAAGFGVMLIWAAWIGWAVLAVLLVGTLLSVPNGRRPRRWRLPMPLHRLVVGLTGTAAVAVVSSPAAAAVAAPAAHAAPAPEYGQNVSAVALRPADAPPSPVRDNADSFEETKAGDGLTTVVSGESRYEHRVRRGDTLSKIAGTWLGDPDRWPEICALNKHRHLAGGRTLTDCDLIYPGWQLRLPADAVPPPNATPARPPRTPSRPAPPPEDAPTEPSSSASAGPGQPPETPGVETTSPTGPSAADPWGADSAEDNARDTAGQELILPDGSIIPWTLAVAITATAALIWLQRRRRYLPGTTDDDLHELPAPVLAAQHHTRHAITAPPATADHPEWLPSGGVGLVGSGADAAARGLIVTALTAGTPANPDQRAEVIIDQHTLATLLGDAPVTEWPRLHITDSLERSLTLLDTHLLQRARILDEHSLTDIDTLRENAPSEQALPPLLLITHTEHASTSTRARVTFGLTHDLQVTPVVLGHWPRGPVLSVTDDGDAHFSHDSRDSALRLAVLDITTTRALLTTVREAHTGEPAPTGEPTQASSTDEATVPATTIPLQADRANRTTPAEPASASTPPQRALLRVLGKPRIENITADGRPLRAKALELAVYLAVHPDGASTREIGEYLEPDARISQADQRVHTNASNLRHVLGRAGTAETKNGYVIKSAGRYRLDAATVDVDVWTLRDLMRKATIATAPRRRELLTAACDLCAAPLAEGQDYEWIQPHRETVRRWGTEAHLLLADDLLDSDPQAASHLLDTAIGLDRYNEALYTKAMHARHALGDADGIRTLLRALTKALADLDAEPREATIELAHKLRTSLDDK